MLCQKCGKKQAAFYYKQNINGKVNEIALCSDCADSMGYSYNMFTNDMGMNLFGSLFGTPSRKNELYSPKVCTLCGSTFQDFIKNGKVGCSKCYEIFKDELAPTITSIHGKARHIGRAPKEHRAKFEKANKIEDLKKQLKEAIRNEDFEKAAKLRDEIHNESEGV